MAALDNIASELLKSANEADLIFKKTRDQAQRDKAVRLRRIVENLRQLVFGASDLNGLSDVTISAPANAQVLTYNSTTTQWENQTPGSGSGIGDMSKSTYDVDNDGIVDGAETIQIIVRNSTGSTLTKGQVVYLSGATGNRPNAVLSKADTEATSSKTIGIVVANIPNNSDGYVAVSGTLHDLDTSAFADGAAVWLSATTAGAYTSTIPSEPNHTVFIGYVARSHPTQGRLVILIQNGYELNELHGVLISAEANNDLLVYESSSTLWKNKTISAIFGGTPLVTVPTLDQVTTAGYTTTNPIIAGQYQIYGTTRNARLSSDNVGGFDINYNIGGTPDWRWFGGGTTALTTFKANGNVLIGTTTDAGYKLDVQGVLRVNGDTRFTGNSYITAGDFHLDNDRPIRWKDSAGNYRRAMLITAVNDFQFGPVDTGWAGQTYVKSGTSMQFLVNGASGTSINAISINTSGNVGINTTSPGEKLQVAGNLHISGVGSALYFDTDASPKSIVQYVNNLYELHIYNGRGITSRIIGGNGFVSLGSGTTQMLYLSTSSTRVGIGTTSPTRKLTLVDTTTGAGLAIDSSTQSDNFYIEASKAGSSRFSVYENSDVVYINAYGRMVLRANQLGGSTGFFGFLGGNLLINTSTDSGYKLNVNGTAFIGGVATLNSDANIAGNVSTPQITSRKYYQNPNGVPTNNLGDPTVTEMALFDEQFDNKTLFYPNIYGLSTLTFETYDGTTWTDISSTITDTDKKKLFGGDNSSNISIPYGTVQYQITINNPSPYVYLNALYCYWSSNGHNTQVQIWKKHNSGSWVQHTNSTTTVSSWPGHLYLPFSTIPWHPSGTLGTHYNQIRVVFTPGWNSGFPANGISLYKMQWWGGYPASKRVIYTTNENRGVGFPADLTTAGALTSTGTFTANSTSTFAQLATFNNGISSRSATPTITFDRNSSYIWRLIVGDGTTYPTSTLNVVNNAGTAITTFLDSGNVGIGTTSPAVTLNVQNGGSTPKAVFQHGTLAHLGVLIGSTGGGFAIEDNNYFAIWHQDYTNRGTETGITERLRITTGGNLLIGTTTDSGYKLDVAGTARVTNGIYFSNSSGSFLWELGAYALRFGTNNTERMRIDSSGNVGVGTTSPYDKLEVNGAISATGAAVANSAQTHATTLSVESGVSYLYAVDWGVEYKPLGVRAQTISLQTGGGSTTDRLFINSTGNVGIGTTSPTARLQVEGSIAATSAIARGTYLNQTLVAAANNDSLVALDINPTFTVGAFTGVISSAIRFPNQTYITTANTTGSFYNVFGTDSNGTLRVGHIGLNTALFGANMSLTGNSVVRFVSNGGTNFVYVYTGTTGNVVLQNGGTFTDAGYRLDVNGTARVQSNFTVDTDTLYVDATNNRVGIGTATPTDKLHIIDSNNANIFGRITATGTNASAAWVAMNNQNDNVVYRVFGDGVSGSQMGISLVRSASLMANLGGSGAFLIGTYSGTDLVFGVQNSECMRIANNTGNVLIGTNVDNGYMLDVAGTINGNSFSVGGIGGWTGTITIITNPPGQQNIQVNSGIITNVF